MQRRGFLKTGGSLALTFLTSPSLRSASHDAAIPKPAADLISSFERLIPPLMREHLIPGVSIALLRDGKLLWTHGFGVQSVDSKKNVTADTIFEAASVSKTVFAYAILKLVDQGTLALDTPLTRYVPWRFIDNDPLLGQITARHLLSHTGGFPDWRSGEKPFKIHSTPGEKFNYSGEGYFYLQSVLTHLTGRVDRTQCATYEAGLEVCATDFAVYMKQHLLEPFGMLKSTFAWTNDLLRQTAVGHREDGKPAPPNNSRPSDAARYGAAGGLLTTARDYARFLLEIIAPKPQDNVRLRSSTRREMIRPQIKLPPAELIDGATSWALGWGVQERPDGNYLVHSGGQSGFRSLAMASPAKRTGFVLLTNSDNGAKLIYHPPILDLLDRVLTTAG